MINSMKVLKLLTCAVFIMFSQQLRAQDSSMSLTLAKAVDMSIQNSKQLKISRARIDQATAVLLESGNQQLPDLKVSGSYLRLNSATVDLKSKSDTGASGPPVKVSQALYGTVNLSLPIYAGGRIKYGIESARFLKQASLLDAESDRDDVVFNTTKAFINLYKSYEAVDVVKENLQSSLSRDTNFSNLEKNGLLARNDLLKSQLQTSNIALSLIDASTNQNLAMINMDLMLGLPENTILVLDTSFINQPLPLKNFEDYKTNALQHRKDVQALSYRKKAAATEIKSARALAYPSLALTGGYIAAYVPNVVTVTNALNVGVGIQYNLANIYKKNTQVLQAQARQAELNANEELLNDNIKSEISQDYQNYLLSQKKLEVYQQAFEQATENYRITKNKYDNSLVTLTDLLDVDVSLLQSKLNIRFARADAVLAYNKLLQSGGSLSK